MFYLPECFPCGTEMFTNEYERLYQLHAEKIIKRWKCRSCLIDSVEDLSKEDTPTNVNYSEEEQLDDGALSLSAGDLTAIGGILKKLIQTDLSPTFRQDFNMFYSIKKG